MKTMEDIPRSINELQNHIYIIYSETNKTRSTEYIYAYLTRNCSYLARSIMRSGDQKTFFLKSFSWLFALSAKLDINLEDAFRRKFPDVCPYCVTAPCICAETQKKPLNYIPDWKIKGELKEKYNVLINRSQNFSIDEAVISINKIYPSNRAIWSAYGSAFHFSRLFEELGEVHEAFGAVISGQKPKSSSEEELADVFAWLLSAWGIENKDLILSDHLITLYYDGCPACKNRPCKCEIYSSRSQALVSLKDIEEFRKILLEIANHSPEKSPALKEIASSFDEVTTTQSTTDAKRIVAQSLAMLRTVESVSASTSSISSSLKSAIDNARLIASNFSWFQ